MTWKAIHDPHTDRLWYWCIRGKDCEITLEPRQPYCDRGNWLAKIQCALGSKLARDMDGQEGWPRYYFDLERAKLECEAWLKKRGQWAGE